MAGQKNGKPKHQDRQALFFGIHKSVGNNSGHWRQTEDGRFETNVPEDEGDGQHEKQHHHHGRPVLAKLNDHPVVLIVPMADADKDHYQYGEQLDPQPPVSLCDGHFELEPWQYRVKQGEIIVEVQYGSKEIHRDDTAHQQQYPFRCLERPDNGQSEQGHDDQNEAWMVAQQGNPRKDADVQQQRGRFLAAVEFTEINEQPYYEGIGE